ncbi:uncharacterized protein [Dermacentor andersoni]|uniref:uncharacterized protein isoform X2 n=1 Tax=Dermacentor andersoni TaxID=34620 RepID=UPI002416B1CC|nr:myosin-6-like isoform X2 [Dermacentor andersoni]
MSNSDEDASKSASSREVRHLTQSVEESIVSKVNELSSALIDTSTNIHCLNSKIQAYRQEQNAAVEVLKENVDVCLRHISSREATTPLQLSSARDSPTNPWRMVRDKEATILELERKNDHLKAKLESAQERLKEKSEELLNSSRLLSEKSQEVLLLQDNLTAAERRLAENQREVERATLRLRHVEEDCEKQTTRIKNELTRLERELLTDRERHSSSLQSLQQELKQVHLESSSWQERYMREKQKASQLSEEVAQSRIQLQRYQKLGSARSEEVAEHLEKGSNPTSPELEDMRTKYDVLKKELMQLKRKVVQNGTAQDFSVIADPEEFNRLILEKRDIEEVCLSFDRKFQKQTQVLKRLDQKLKESEAKVEELTRVKFEKQKSYQVGRAHELLGGGRTSPALQTTRDLAGAVDRLRASMAAVARIVRKVDDWLRFAVLVNFLISALSACVVTYAVVSTHISTEKLLCTAAYAALTCLSIADASLSAGDVKEQALKLKAVLDSASVLNLPPRVTCQVELFSMTIDEKQLCFTGSGFFIVDRPMLTSFVGLVMTYSIIVVQTGRKPEAPKCQHHMGLA